MKVNVKKVMDVLDRDLTTEELEVLRTDWKAFSENPELYRHTIVPQLVHNWLDRKRATH